MFVGVDEADTPAKNRPLMNPEEIDTTRFSRSRFL